MNNNRVPLKKALELTLGWTLEGPVAIIVPMLAILGVAFSNPWMFVWAAGAFALTWAVTYVHARKCTKSHSLLIRIG